MPVKPALICLNGTAPQHLRFIRSSLQSVSPPVLWLHNAAHSCDTSLHTRPLFIPGCFSLSVEFAGMWHIAFTVSARAERVPIQSHHCVVESLLRVSCNMLLIRKKSQKYNLMYVSFVVRRVPSVLRHPVYVWCCVLVYSAAVQWGSVGLSIRSQLGRCQTSLRRQFDVLLACWLYYRLDVGHGRR